MRWVWMWIRQTWWWSMPIQAAGGMFAMLSRFSWAEGWSTMVGWWSGSTLLLSPIAAAVTVAAVLRNYPLEAQCLLAPTRRHARPLWHLCSAVAAQGLAVMVVLLIIGCVVCWTNGAEPSGVVWLQFFTGPVALVAAVFLGGLLAQLIPSNWTVPVVALGLFLAHRPFIMEPYPELFTIEGPTVVMAPQYQPMVSHFAATVTVNGLAAGTAGVLIWFFSAPHRLRSWWPILTAIVLLVGIVAVYFPWVTTDDWSTYEPLS